MSSITMKQDIKRWAAKRKSALVLDIIQGKTTISEANRTYYLSPVKIESWVEDGWDSLALVIVHHTRELLSWHLSCGDIAMTASNALEA